MILIFQYSTMLNHYLSQKFSLASLWKIFIFSLVKDTLFLETCLWGSSFTFWAADFIWTLEKLSLYLWRIPYLKLVYLPLNLLSCLSIVDFIARSSFCVHVLICSLVSLICSYFHGHCLWVFQGWRWISIHVLQHRENLRLCYKFGDIALHHHLSSKFY